MAGLGRRTFAPGNKLFAADVQGYLMDQSVMVFANASARTTAIASPSAGMVTYLVDLNQLQFWNGTAWSAIGAGGGLENTFLLMGA